MLNKPVVLLWCMMMDWLVPYLLSLSAASFIYIALADLVPGRRSTGGLKSLVWELALIALGVGTICVLRSSSTG